ncbi:serine hydrolase domain-containing protein [Pararhodobacter zhoushanensis]|uniref:serine hydrolase domain-containing protein n=1 Tax=Pararhodobacter zhoushanensis TaxID=2479545 RepID=UPI000F8EDA8B|nr:serine hydrolase [Pararhodobacter zhoushanensis]
MRKFFKRLGWVVLVLVVLAAAVGFWKREDLTRLMAVNSLFAEDRIVQNFSHMDTLFHSAAMQGGTPSVLPQGTPAQMPEGFDAWQEARHVTATVVLHDGALVYENYRLGTDPQDLRVSWSVAKSALSLLLGTLVADGTIPDLDAPVTQYAPELRGSAYDGASIRNVLNMASGVAFNEDYLDFWSDINRMGRVLALGGSMDGFSAGQTGRIAPPGTEWHYVSIDTHVISMVIRGATGRTIPDLMQERLFIPLGLERAPYYVTDGHGVAFVLGGLNLTTRDYARLGQLVEQGGVWQGRQIIPADWVAQSTAASAPGDVGYGYQWWIPPAAAPGEVYARGVYGQFIWIDRDRNVVIAVNSADRAFREPGVMDANIAMLRAIADSLSPLATPQPEE